MQEIIGAAGGIDLLLGAIKAHPNNGSLQEHVCLTLRSLSTRTANKVCCFWTLNIILVGRFFMFCFRCRLDLLTQKRRVSPLSRRPCATIRRNICCSKMARNSWIFSTKSVLIGHVYGFLSYFNMF